MKKFLISAVSALLLATFTAPAEVQTNYTESFAGLNTTSETFAPRGWKHFVYSSYYKTTYTAHDEGGPDGGGWLEAGPPYSSYYNYYDGFITPKLNGTVTLKVKKTSDAGTIYFGTSPNGKNWGDYSYSPTKYNGTVEGLDDLVTGEWGTVTLPDVPDGTYIYFAPTNMGIAEVTMAQCDLIYNKEISMSVSRNSSYTPQETADHKITFKFDVRISNLGDFDIPANTIKITVTNNNLDGRYFGEFTIAEPLPMGGKIELLDQELTGDCAFSEGAVQNAFFFTENYTNTSNSVWISYKPFAPVYNFTYAESGQNTISDGISFGPCAPETSKTFYVYNSGADEMNVTSVTVPAGFTITTPTTFKVAAGESKPVTIKTSATAGYAEGNLVIATDKLSSFTYKLNAFVMPANAWRESFEDESMPAGFIIGSYWSLSKTDAGLGTEGNAQWITQNSSSYPSDIITPLIATGDEGDYLYIFANKNDNTSGKMEVFTSTDRLEWTSVYKIGTYSSSTGDDYFSNDPMSETCSGYGLYAWKLFRVPLPAGDCYVKINGGGIRINDIAANALVDVEHDLNYEKDTTPGKGMVNNPYNTSVTLRNVNREDETGYTVSMILDGNKYAAKENDDFTAGSVKEFTFSMTPHEVGTFTVCYEFAKGDFSYTTPEKEMTVGEEVAQRDVQVGEDLISSDGPINTYYKNTITQVIYTADKLGIAANSSITGMSYIGYIPQTGTGHITVHLMNTDGTEFEESPEQSSSWLTYYDPYDEDDMTLVYDNEEYTYEAVGSGSSDRHPCLPIEFDTPFVYTGENLLIQVTFSQPSYTSSSYYSFDNSTNPDNKFIKFTTDNDMDDLDLVRRFSMNTYGVPVVVLSVEKDVAVVNGTVTDEVSEEPIEGAQVSFVSGEVIYKATTDDKGEYTVTVFQSDLTFDAEVSASAYETTTESDVTFTAGEEPNVKDYALERATADLEVTADPADGSELEKLETITLAFEEGLTLTLNEAATVTVAVDGEEVTTGTVKLTEDGEAVITLEKEVASDKDAKCTVTVPEYAFFVTETADDETVNYFSGAITLEYSLKATAVEDGIASIVADGQDFTVYTVSGIRVAENSVDNLPAAIYIVRRADGSAAKITVK